jgi:hypothetical protein
MLYVLTFVACLAGTQPDRCEQVELPWEGSLLQCQMFGQMAAAGWLSEHSGYRLRGGYRCLNGRAV